MGKRIEELADSVTVGWESAHWEKELTDSVTVGWESARWEKLDCEQADRELAGSRAAKQSDQDLAD